MCGGSKGTGSGGYAQGLPVAQQNFTQASPEAMGWYRQAMGLASQAAATPWQNYSTDPSAFVAQLNPQQQQAIQGLSGQAAATQPFAQMGAGMQAAAGMGNAAQMAGAYMNPFMQQVVSPVQQALQQQQGQQLAQQQAEAIKAGAFGGDRAGLQRQVLRGQQQLGMGQALSPLYQTGYGQALGAAQTDLARQLQAGQGLSQSGLQAQQAALAAGTLGQQTEQAGKTALYNQFQQARMYPYQQAQFLAGIAGGLGPLLGQTTTQTQATNPFGMFLANGGVAGGRMGGAVVDMEPGKDYWRGGLAAGGVYEDPLDTQREMYKGLTDATEATMPTGQIQAAQGLTPAEFAPQQKPDSMLDKAGKIAGLAEKGLSIGSKLGGLGSALKTGLSLIGLKDGGVAGYRDGGDPSNNDMAAYLRPLARIETGGQKNPYAAVGPATKYGHALGKYQIMEGNVPEWSKAALGRALTKEQFLADADAQEKIAAHRFGQYLDKTGVPEEAAAMWFAGPGYKKHMGAKDVLGTSIPQYMAKYKAGLGEPNLEKLGPRERSFMALDPEAQKGIGAAKTEEQSLLREENVVPALMGLGSALEGMLTAKTLSPGAAVATGLAHGLKEGTKSYMEVPKIKAETLERQNLAQRALEEAKYKAAEIPKVEAETKKELAQLYEKQWVPNVGWMVYDKSNPLKTPVPISDAEGNPISGSKITPEDLPTKPGGDKPSAPTTGAPGKEPPVAGAMDWQPTLKAPASTKIPGALNIAMSGDLPKQQEAAKQYIEQQRTKTDSANAQLYRLDEMERQFKSLPKEGFLTPGAYSGERTEVAKRINELTSILGGAPLFDPNNLAAAETLAKDTTRLGFDVSKSLGHEPGFIVQAATKANPGMENTPMAFNRITAGLKEAAHYEQDKLAFFEDYAARFGTLTGAEKLFRELNPPSAYANRAILSTIAPEDMSYMKSLTKKQLAMGRDKIDKTYGAGVTDLLLGGK